MWKRKDDLVGQSGVIIERSDGISGWAIVGAGGLVGVALVIIALALFSISQYAGVAVIVAASGQFMLATCTGVARIVEARGRARAMIEETRWRALAGPVARADAEALWGDER